MAASVSMSWERMDKLESAGLRVDRIQLEVPLVYTDIKQPSIVQERLGKLKRRKLTITTYRVRSSGESSSGDGSRR